MNLTKRPTAITCVMLSILLAVTSSIDSSAAGRQGNAERMKARISRFRIGEIVKVQLNDAEMKGRITGVHATDFVVAEKTTGEAKTMAYTDVKDVHKDKLPIGVKIVLWTAVGFGIVAGTAAIICARGCGG